MDNDEHMEDVESAGEPPLGLSDDERQVLELYDRLQQMDLEIAIINAQKAHVSTSTDDSPDALAAAQEALLQARSRYKLRNDAVELVMMVHPVLKAVHGSTNASPIDRDLLPYIVKRDDAAVEVARAAAQAQATRDALTDVQVETLRACRRNVTLTSRLFELAGQLEERRAVDWHGGEEALRVREEKRKWRAVKGAASGIVAGSGVDWASDEALREMVLDPEDDD
ncbi:Centromere protein Cenp-H [Cordyceps fumosorosea ARSEF 2679]|uniref:Centromere protein Cenp-H n=1 Tax=Cordyceps fumosorosea (strain ARSEF 2679) TaxID=1081104 RepID=A0A167ZIX8_CORFA|nr:Centromere protein Cenp-H [Cordyceps fumosorosea ARSEF 2679]OAA67573.1 Centromere protein Cenp-H [Cordyceps fumosorosea ARSEF 2679]